LSAEILQPAIDPHDLVTPEMALAEKLIFQACQSQVAAVSLGAAHIMRAGGKRLRPLVLILAAKACGYEGAERPARLGAAVELIHTATLVHDDVVDEADTRRGQYSVNIFLGNEASVLMGDYLVCRALRMVAEDADSELMCTICDVIVSMCEAEVLQITYRGDLENTFDNYLKVIRNKTACLFSFTALAGGRLARMPEVQIEQLRLFGLNLGVAFQIVDDILDLLGDEEQLGKPTGSDLREGKFTYPVLHAIASLEGPARQRLTELLSDTHNLSVEGVQDVVDLVREANGFQAAYDCAAGYVERALSALNGFPDNVALQALRSLTAGIVERRA
jgi:octaprenyl-diphosphate synthase